MKYLALLLLVVGGPAWHLLTSVRDRNEAVATATAAYARGNAGRAATAFAAALATQPQKMPDPRLLLNLGHAQALDVQQAAARATYGRLLKDSPAPLGSVARQQLAVLAARQGDLAQALSLLRQALLLDPQNAGARFDYEVLSEYLANKPNRPKITPPTPAPSPAQPKPAPAKEAAYKTRNANKAGSERQGEINDTKPAPAANTPQVQRPAPNGQPDPKNPDTAPGNAANGGRQPGAGTPQPMASGTSPGAQRGLDRGSTSPASAAGGRSNRPGTEAAAPADLSLQTQRERLQAMNLSPAQARQLLETLRAQEQQYLQQLTRPAPQKPDPNRPTW
jgi:tetratricopeptide (TPR) repeat protein